MVAWKISKMPKKYKRTVIATKNQSVSRNNHWQRHEEKQSETVLSAADRKKLEQSLRRNSKNIQI